MGGASPVEVARALCRAARPGVILFDASRAPRRVPRHSYVSCLPRDTLVERDGAFFCARGGVLDPAQWLRERAGDGPRDGFAGGVAGVLGFEVAWSLDPPRAPRRAARTPALWAGWYPAAARYDHVDGSWSIAGDPASPAWRALRAAVEEGSGVPRGEGALSPPRMLCGEDPGATYAREVQRMVDAITRGDLFEVNYTERFEAAWSGEPFALYEAMREVATGAHFGFLDAGDFQVCSVSPERFVEASGGRLTARPIKGSRRRGATPEDDAASAEALRTSEKDRAENVMIVDLMRNDLTRVCALGSVRAEEVCALETFAGIHHLVSTVVGQLEHGLHPIDALLACSPPGSITGAPKLRSIEYIAEREHTARGVYTGSLFWSSGDAMDANVLIRTAELVSGVARYGAGGAVVSGSSPEAERDEAWLKARPFFEVAGAKEGP